MKKIEELGKEVTTTSPENIIAAYREDGSVYVQVSFKDKSKIMTLIFLILGAVIKNGGKHQLPSKKSSEQN